MEILLFSQEKVIEKSENFRCDLQWEPWYLHDTVVVFFDHCNIKM